MRDDFEHDGFLAALPWRCVADPDKPYEPGGPVSLLCVTTADGRTGLAVFTDDDLAGRFVRGVLGRPAMVLVLDTPGQAIVSLESVDPAACSHVAFDPGPRVLRRAYPIPDVIETLQGLV